MMNRLAKWKVKVFFADHWDVYPKLISSGRLIQTKRETHGIERNNSRQRHWFARFRRKTCVVSRSSKMVDLTMMLFAKYHINSTFEFSLFN